MDGTVRTPVCVLSQMQAYDTGSTCTGQELECALCGCWAGLRLLWFVQGGSHGMEGVNGPHSWRGQARGCEPACGAPLFHQRPHYLVQPDAGDHYGLSTFHQDEKLCESLALKCTSLTCSMCVHATCRLRANNLSRGESNHNSN